MPGTLLDRWAAEELQDLNPVQAALGSEDGREGETVPVRLHSRVTEVGTLDLSFHATRGEGKWKLEFDVREPS